MRKYHITIKNNETGEIINDVDSDAIIGSIESEEGTANVVMTECNIKQLIESIFVAKRAIKDATKLIMADAPEGLGVFLDLLSKLDDLAKEEDGDADTDATEN